jgi:Uncharacterised nucleotidyltransferase
MLQGIGEGFGLDGVKVVSKDASDANSAGDCSIAEFAVAKLLAGRSSNERLTDVQAEAVARYLGSIWHVAPAAVPLFLGAFDSQISSKTRARLEALAEAATIHGKLFRQVAAEVAGAFADRDVELVALKGTASGFLGYDDPAHRTGADLDFCVRPDALEVAKDIMGQVGFWAGDYDSRTQTFVPSDETVRAERETGHYALGFWVKILDIGEVSPRAAEGFRLAGDLLPFASEVKGTRVRTPVLVDIHHSVGVGVSADDIMNRPRPHRWNGATVLLPPSEWVAFHALLKLYWEGGQAYGKGFQYLADFARILPLLSDEESDSLVGLIEAHNLRPGGYHVLRRMPFCTGVDISRLSPVLDSWSLPPRDETPFSYNDIGDFWPRLFSRL